MISRPRYHRWRTRQLRNLPPVEYLPVINEKTGGNPIRILAPDGPAAEEALAERTEILRKLSVTEIRRLMGSAMAAIAGFTARKQALHDLLAGTLVVQQD